MAFEAEVWSTLENDLFDESGGSARIAGVVLNIAVISHSRQWVIVCFRGKTGHDDCTAECLFLTQSGHSPALQASKQSRYDVRAESSRTNVCPLSYNSGQSRILVRDGLSANDPKRTSALNQPNLL
jgi:hypothetical protein